MAIEPLPASSPASSQYSELIESHDTRPRDIERALFDELASNGELRKNTRSWSAASSAHAA